MQQNAEPTGGQSDSAPGGAYRTLVGLAAFVIVIAGLKQVSSVLVPLFAAVFVAIIVWPFIALFRRTRMPSWLSLALTLVLLLGVLGGIGALIGTSVSSFLSDMGSYEAQLNTKFNDMIAWANRLLAERGFDDYEISASMLLNSLQMDRIFSGVGSLVAGIGSLVSNSIMTVILLIFLLMEASLLPKKFRLAFDDADEDLDRAQKLIGNVQRYILVKTSMGLISGTLATIACWAVGIPHVFLWGLLAFLLNYVPTVGSLIAAIPPVLLAILVGGFPPAIILSLVFIGINLGVDSFLEPKLMGRTFGLSTFFVLLLMLFWGYVLGPIGMLLSVPLTMIVKVLLAETEELAWVSLMIGSGAEVKQELDEEDRAGTGRMRKLSASGAVSLTPRGTGAFHSVLLPKEAEPKDEPPAP